MKKSLTLSASIVCILLLGFVVGVPEALASPKAQWELSWDKTLEAAKIEGKLNLYTTLGVKMRTTLSEDFTKRHGIILEVTSGRTSQILAKIGSERRAARAIPTRI